MDWVSVCQTFPEPGGFSVALSQGHSSASAGWSSIQLLNVQISRPMSNSRETCWKLIGMVLLMWAWHSGHLGIQFFCISISSYSASTLGFLRFATTFSSFAPCSLSTELLLG